MTPEEFMGVNFNKPLKPSYYSSNGHDLFDRFETGLLTSDEVRGFYKGNVIKYLIRYQNKNGVEDLNKAATYLDRLTKFEQKISNQKSAEALNRISERTDNSDWRLYDD